MKKQNLILLRALSLLVIIFFASGCASIVNSGPREININSTPTGAALTVKKTGSDMTVFSGKTPATIQLSSRKAYFAGQSYTVTLEHPGYKPTTVEIKPSFSGWYVGNILFGGVIGMLIVDPLTGAMWNLAPNTINEALKPEGEVAAINPSETQ